MLFLECQGYLDFLNISEIKIRWSLLSGSEM